MGRFGIGLAILFAIVFVVYVVRQMIPVIITGTTTGDNLYTYLVPITIVMGGLAAIFFTWFNPFNRGGGE